MSEREIEINSRVRTTKPNGSSGWSEPRKAKWGVLGFVFDKSDSHGVCYGVKHEDGSEAYYEIDELELLPIDDRSTTHANQVQFGGTHYKTEPGFEEHWDRIWRTRGVEGGRGYFIGCITKYVERFDEKNGIEDLKKAQHYIQKLIELEEKENEKRKQSD